MENNIKFFNWCQSPNGGSIKDDTANKYWVYLSKEIIFNDGHITKIVDYDELVKALGCEKVSTKDDKVFEKMKFTRPGITEGNARSAINKYIKFLKFEKYGKD